jgi:DNA-binding XRE family transcriptional regulator
MIIILFYTFFTVLLEAVLITGRQIRAARALLDISQDDLANAAGLTKQGISKIEDGSVQPREGTMTDIQRVFRDKGIEFTEDQGVKFKPSGLEVFEGPERFDEFYDFLYEYLKHNGGEVCLSISDQSLLDKCRKNPELHYKRVKALYEAGVIKKFRILASKSEYMHHPLFSVFKLQPEGGISPTGFWAFGDCLALISFVHHNPPYVVLLRSATLAEAYRQAFNVTWAVAKDPPPLESGDKK